MDPLQNRVLSSISQMTMFKQQLRLCLPPASLSAPFLQRQENNRTGTRAKSIMVMLFLFLLWRVEAEAGDTSTPVIRHPALYHLFQPELQTSHSVQWCFTLSLQPIRSLLIPSPQSIKILELHFNQSECSALLSCQLVKLIATTFTCNIRGSARREGQRRALQCFALIFWCKVVRPLKFLAFALSSMMKNQLFLAAFFSGFPIMFFN